MPNIRWMHESTLNSRASYYSRFTINFIINLSYPSNSYKIVILGQPSFSNLSLTLLLNGLSFHTRLLYY
jgi:hypothetical protein